MLGFGKLAKKRRAFETLLTVLLMYYPGGSASAKKEHPILKEVTKLDTFKGEDISGEQAALGIVTGIYLSWIDKLDMEKRHELWTTLAEVNWDSANEAYLERIYKSGKGELLPDHSNLGRTIAGTYVGSKLFGALDRLNRNDVLRFELQIHMALLNLSPNELAAGTIETCFGQRDFA